MPPFFTYGQTASSRLLCSCTSSSTLCAVTRYFTSGFSLITPSPEHGASSSTMSIVPSSSSRCLRASRVIGRTFSSPRRCTCAAIKSARCGCSSHACTRPVPCIISAIRQLLPPGAAQASRICIPFFGAAARQTIMLLSLWMENLPPTKPASCAISAMLRMRHEKGSIPFSFSQTLLPRNCSKAASSIFIRFGRMVMAAFG